MEDGGFEAVNFGETRSHINYIFCFSVGSHCDVVRESVMKEKWKCFERTWKEEEEEWMFLKQTKCKKLYNDKWREVQYNMVLKCTIFWC